MSELVEVVEYSPDWPNHFSAIVAMLRQHRPLTNVVIEHVGSTSVKEMAAKPIIDIDIVATSPRHTKELIAALAELGYTHRGDLGISGREAFGVPTGNSLPDHHLYVCIENGVALKNHLLLREILRINKQKREEYGHLKVSLAKKHSHDIARYCEAKSDFILKLLIQGGMWAEEVQIILNENKI